MDCETEEEFQVQLESLKDVWIEQEKAYLPAGKQPSIISPVYLGKGDRVIFFSM